MDCSILATFDDPPIIYSAMIDVEDEKNQCEDGEKEKAENDSRKSKVETQKPAMVDTAFNNSFKGAHRRSSSRNRISDEDQEPSKQEENVVCQGPCGGTIFKSSINSSSNKKEEWLLSNYCSDCQKLITNAGAASIADFEEEASSSCCCF